MAKKAQTKHNRAHAEGQQLIWGAVLFILFIICVMTVFYFMKNGGAEVLQEVL